MCEILKFIACLKKLGHMTSRETIPLDASSETRPKEIETRM